MKHRRIRQVGVLLVALLAASGLQQATAAAAATTAYEAENATIVQGTVANNHTGFTGTGFVDYTNVTGSYVEFHVSVAAAGSSSR
ncbi:carbohydrate-binding protein [Fodinicola feengrottensis]|uniref:hypothetical protein n=1 Tax=Fodinicola feengrottensis TaxID=435914 RepID=UPI0013D04303|nr:hypothetical protein [Fodinicola feengrottensis]